MDDPQAIRSVVRAIGLLRALNLRPVATINFMHQETKIPKPSIVRMMQTLESCGLVKHAPQHGAYFLSSGVLSLSHGYHSEPMLVEAAAPLMDQLTLRVKWPVALAVLEDFSMVVRYSTIPLSPLALRHSTLNMRLSLTSRAIGRAYLAFCAPDQQKALLEALKYSSKPEDSPSKDMPEMLALLSQIKTQGYATRHPEVSLASNTLAVPIFDQHGVAAALGLTYFSSIMSPEQAVAKHLNDLTELAGLIGERLKELKDVQSQVL
jgi:IclR family mhp operon transcriptional activator